MLSKETVDELFNKIEEVHLKVSLLEKSHFQVDDWVGSLEASKVLKVTPRTVQNYRDQGIIPFSKIRGKIVFRMKDLQSFLMQNRVESFSFNLKQKKGGNYHD